MLTIIPRQHHALFKILKDPPIYRPHVWGESGEHRMLLLEVQLLGAPEFLTNRPVYVTAVLGMPLAPITCIVDFNQSVIVGVQMALEQHYFNRPGFTAAECALSGLVRFALGLKNTWTYCPNFGKMGARSYLYPAHFMGYMLEFVLDKSPRVPVHVDVDIVHGQEAKMAWAYPQRPRFKRKLEDIADESSSVQNSARRPRTEPQPWTTYIPDAY